MDKSNEQVDLPKAKPEKNFAKSLIAIILIVVLFFSGFGSALVVNVLLRDDKGSAVEENATVKDDANESAQGNSTEEQSLIPAGFKKIENSTCDFSALMPEAADYEEERGNYQWEITENLYEGDPKFELQFDQVIIGISRKDGLGGGYVPGWVVVDCAEANGKNLSQAFDALKADLDLTNQTNNDLYGDNTSSFAVSREGFMTMWGEESILFIPSGGYSSSPRWLVVKNDIVYRISTLVYSEDRGIQNDTRIVFDSLEF